MSIDLVVCQVCAVHVRAGGSEWMCKNEYCVLHLDNTGEVQDHADTLLCIYHQLALQTQSCVISLLDTCIHGPSYT